MIMDAYFVSGNWSILLTFPCPGKLLLYFETIWAWSWENWDSVQLLVANLVEMCFYSCLSLPEECPAVQQIHHIRWFGLLYHARSWALEPEEVTLLSVSFLSIIRTRKRYHDNGYCLMLNRTIRICNMLVFFWICHMIHFLMSCLCLITWIYWYLSSKLDH